MHVAIRSSEVMREEEIEQGYGYKVCQSITERFRVEADRRGVCNCGREPKRAQIKGAIMRWCGCWNVNVSCNMRD